MLNIFSVISGNPAMCDFAAPTYLFISANVPPLVYYSHLPIAVLSFFIGTFILFVNRKGLANQVLFTLTFAFTTWVLLDSIFWASNRSDIIMFVWSLQILVEPIVFACGYYLSKLLTEKTDILFGEKLLVVGLYLPIVIMLPTRYTLSGFDTTQCLSTEGPIAYYTYFVEIAYTVLLIVTAARRYVRTKDTFARKNIFYVTGGVLLLLLAFAFGNIISSFTEDWNYAQIGLFTMPLFISLLTFIVIRYGAFNLKLFSAQAMVAALWFLVFALFFMNGQSVTFIIVLITLIFVSLIGYLLVKSVAKEIRQRELLEKLSATLEETNQQLTTSNDRLRIMDQRKSEFVSIASHQLRTPVTAMKGYSSLLLEDAYGALPEKMKDPIEKIYHSSERLALMINDFLNVSKIEQGSMTYTFVPLDLKKMVVDIVQDFHVAAGEKKLDVETDIPDNIKYNVVADEGKIRQIISNLLDNAIKYTPKGSVRLILSKEPEKGDHGMVHLQIKDTGIGLSQDDIHHLFGKFTRGAEGSKVNTTGSGLGLYVAKQMMEKHQGNIWVDSEGKGRGSVFSIELPEFHGELPKA